MIKHSAASHWQSMKNLDYTHCVNNDSNFKILWRMFKSMGNFTLHTCNPNDDKKRHLNFKLQANTKWRKKEYAMKDSITILRQF